MGLAPQTSSTNPVALADVKAHLRIDNDIDANTSSDDPTLTLYLAAALEHVETETRQQLMNRTWVMTLDDFPSGNIVPARESYTFDRITPDRAIRLLRPPLQSVTSIQYNDATGTQQTFNTSAYAVDATTRPGRIVLKPGQCWPQTDQSAANVRITYIAGYGADASDVPMILRQCILLMVGHYYENREGAIDRRIDCIPLGVESIIASQMFPEAVG